MEKEKIRILSGGNMDIDLHPNPDVSWSIEPCPWNELEGSLEHKCAVKNTSICKYFRGIEPIDNVLCAFPIEEEN
jgi:hypothetical protein